MTDNGSKTLHVLIPSLVSATVFSLALTWLLDIGGWEEATLTALSGLLAFTLKAYLIHESRDEKATGRRRRRLLRGDGRLAFMAAYLAALLCIILTPSPCDSSIFVPWPELPASAWARLVAALLLIGFLPGFAILRVSRASRKSLLETALFSYFVSALLYVCLFELALALGLSRPGGLRTMLIAVNGVILTAYLIETVRESHRKPKGDGGTDPPTWTTTLESLVLVSLSALAVSGAAIIAAHYSPLVRGDVWLVHGCSTRFYKAELVNGDFTMHYHWYEYLACFYALAGLPTANALTALIAFGPMIYLAFYLMARALSGGRRRVALLATVLMFSAGFGWTYFIYLRDVAGLSVLTALRRAADLTYDIWYPSLMFPRMVTRKFLFALPALFALCYLILDRSAPGRLRYPMMAVLVAVGYLFHSFEVLFFLLAFTVYTLIRWLRGALDQRLLVGECASISTGGLLAIALDAATPHPCHLLPAVDILGAILSVVLWPPALLGLTYVLQHARRLIHRPEGLRMPRAPAWARIPALFILLYLYGLSFLIVFGDYGPDFTLFFLVPAYYYPMKLGVIGALTLVYLALPRAERRIDGGAFIIALLVAYGLTIGAIRAWAATVGPGILFLEFRTFALALAALGVPSALATRAVLDRARAAEVGGAWLASSLLALLLFTGLASNLLSIEMWALKGVRFPEEAFEAAAYVADVLPPGRSALAISPFSWEVLVASGVQGYWVTPCPYDGYWAFTSASKPGTYLVLLSEARVAYALVMPVDAYFAEGCFFTRLTPYLRPIIEASDVEVFEVPLLSGPEPISNVVVLRQEPQLVLIEDFEGYEDGGLPEGWESQGGCGVRDGELRIQDGAWCVLKPAELVSFRLHVKLAFLELIPATARARFCFGYSSPGDFYSIDIHVDKVVLTACSSGQEEVLCEEPAYLTPGIPNSIVVEVSGLRVSVWLDQMVALEGRLPEVPEGPLALAAEGCRVALDDLEIYAVFPDELAYEPPCYMLALSGAGFSTAVAWDPRALDADILVVPDGPYGDVAGLVSFVERGGRLVVMDVIGLGSLAQLLALNSTGERVAVDGLLHPGGSRELPAFTTEVLSCGGEDVDVVAYFTSGGEPVAPYAFRKPIGSGEVLYLHIGDYLRTMLAHGRSGQEGWRWFNGLGPLAQVLGLSAGPPPNGPSYPDHAGGFIRLWGDVVLWAWSLLSDGGALFTADEVWLGEEALGSAEVELLELRGHVEVTIKTNLAEIRPQRALPYSYAGVRLPKGCDIELKASEDGLLVVSVAGGGELVIRNGTLRMRFNRSVDLYVRGLEADVVGGARFEELRCSADGSPMVIKWSPVEAQGSIRLRVRAADTSILILDGLELAGEVRILPEEPVPLLPLLDVRWGELLFSMHNLLVLACAYAIVATWVLRRWV